MRRSARRKDTARSKQSPCQPHVGTLPANLMPCVSASVSTTYAGAPRKCLIVNDLQRLGDSKSRAKPPAIAVPTIVPNVRKEIAEIFWVGQRMSYPLRYTYSMKIEMTKEEQILAIERIFAALGYGKTFRPHISDEEAAKIAEEYDLTKH